VQVRLWTEAFRCVTGDLNDRRPSIQLCNEYFRFTAVTAE